MFKKAKTVVKILAFAALILALPRTSLAANSPSITTQPQSQTNLFGSNTVFTVVATGQAPLVYQWSFNSANLVNNSHIGGATGASLTVSNITTADAGNYRVIVSNSHGSVTSSVVTLTVTNHSLYVNLNNPTPVAPYASWSTAATNIQDAVDAAGPGDNIWVTNGIYSSGNRITSATTNRVVVQKYVLITGVAGANQTIIDGGGSNRCIYLGSGATLTGFTLQNGTTVENGGGVYCETTNEILSNCVLLNNNASGFGGSANRGTLNDCMLASSAATLGAGAAYNTLNRCVVTRNTSGGGAVFLATLNSCLVSNNYSTPGLQVYGGGAVSSTLYGSTVSGNQASQAGGGAYSCTLSNCLVTDNSAAYRGGGADNCTLYFCVLSNNIAAQLGGGAFQCALYDCLLVNNSAHFGGAAQESTLVQCTAAGNIAWYGGGTSYCSLTNSIVYYNTGYFGNENYVYTNAMSWCCTSPQPDPSVGVGNISTAPVFVDTGRGNYQLWPGSPGIDAGNNAFAPATYDLAGKTRIANGTVDMGAYEFQNSPFFYLQPTNQAVPVGTNIALSALASGIPAPAYRWYYNGLPLTDNARYSGTASTTLQVFNPTTNDTGNYYVVATNILGVATSSIAMVSVLVPVTVTLQPTNLTLVQGSLASFSAAGSGGAPLGYQWLFNGYPLSNDGQHFGVTTTNLTIFNVQAGNAGNYSMIVSNPASSATTTVASLTVLVPAYITAQPLSTTSLIGGTATFSAAADGTGTLVYQWQQNGTNLTDSAHITGSTTPTLTISNVQMSDLAAYQVVVTNLYDTATSMEADLSVVPLVEWGDNAQGQANFPASATNALRIAAGADFTIVLSDQGKVSGWGNNWAGQATSLGSLNNVIAIAAGYNHSLALTSNGKVTAKGDNYNGQSSVPAGLSNVVSIAAGYFESMALKKDGTVACWGWNGNGQANVPAGLTNVVGIACGFTHNLAVLSDGTVTGWGYNYYGECTPPPGLSNVVAVAANIYYSMALRSDGTVVAWGDGGSGQTNIPPGLSNVVSIAAGSSFCLALRSDGTVVSWGSGAPPLPPGMSNVVSIAVGGDINVGYVDALALVASPVTHVPPQIVWQPAARTLSTGQSTLLNSQLTGSLPFQYHWYFNGAALPPETNSWLMLSAIQPAQAGNYQFVASNNYGAVTSQVVVVSEIPTLLTQPADQSVLLGSNATFNVTVSGVGPLNYQWYHRGTNLFDGGRISGSTTASLTLANLQTNDAGAYQLVLTNATGAVTSSIATLTVLVPAAIINQPTNRISPVGSNVTLTTTSVGTAPLVYQWTSNGIPLVNGGRISGATAATLTITGALTNDSASYQLIVTNNYGAATSSVAMLTVYIPVQLIAPPGSQSVLLGTAATFTVIAAGTGPLSYQWYYNGLPLTDAGRISGSTTSTLTISTIQNSDAGGYSVTVSNLYGGAVSLPAALTPQAVIAPSTRYVNLNNPNPASPYLDWNSAATNIQDAIDAAVAGDLVLVTNGVYATGGRAVYASVTNRVVVHKALTVQSVNGPGSTTIKGDFTPPTRGGPSLRCVYLTNNAVLSGFTLTNGGIAFAFNLVQSNLVRDASGAGVWCESSDSVVTNCYITGNNASQYGGGACQGTLLNCVVTNNAALQGGGSFSNLLINCLLVKNTGTGQESKGGGGGAMFSTLNNCVLVGNQCNSSGGGAYISTLASCVLSNNTASIGGGVFGGTTSDSLISSNRASVAGGGAYSNTMNHCVLVANFCSNNGGGAYASSLTSCVLSNNSAGSGGAVYFGTITDSLISSNRAVISGGGAYSNILTRCILVTNTALQGGGTYLGTLFSCALTNNRATGGTGGGSYQGTISNSVYFGNWAYNAGGAAELATLYNSYLISNSTAYNQDGGVYGGVLYNCLLRGNSGGEDNATLYNCTLVQNSANTGGGVFGGKLLNCIVYYNSAPTGTNWFQSPVMSNCCTVPLPPGGGNFTNAPLFVDLANGDFHLQPGSPCINAGNNAFVSVGADLDGLARIAGGTVDAGAYEFQSPASVLSYVWLQQNGLPMDGSADYADTDGDGMSNYAEWKAGTSPTNASSVLQLASPAPTNGASGPAGMVISWQSVPGTTYFIQRSSNLGGGFSTMQSNLPGQSGQTTFTDTAATNGGPYFYRIGVQ